MINNSMHKEKIKVENRWESKGGRSLAFKDLKEVNSSWRSVLHLSKHKKCMRGEYVQQGNNLMFLDRGSIRMTHQSLDGAEKVLWYIREGCIFGESEFFDAMQTEYYWLCMSTCSIYTFSPENIKQIEKERPELLFNLLQSMARKLKILGLQASSLCLDSVLVRICKFLSQRVVPGSSPLVAHIGVSRQEMASLLGVHRVSLYRVLRQQEKLGLFGSVTGQNMTILDPHEFYNLAGM